MLCCSHCLYHTHATTCVCVCGEITKQTNQSSLWKISSSALVGGLERVQACYDSTIDRVRLSREEGWGVGVTVVGDRVGIGGVEELQCWGVTALKIFFVWGGGDFFGDSK